MAVNLFGHPARLRELRDLADRHGIYLIEDNAQAPLGSEEGVATGMIGHIGIASLNYHKHIHTGEGGVCVTDDDDLANRIQLIRNHAENLVEHDGIADAVNMVGFNFRMTELSAAVGLVQLADIERHVSARERLAEILSDGTRDLEGWAVPKVRAGCRHNYYIWLVKFDQEVMGVSRELFSKALAAEGFPHYLAYVPPLYRLPLFQRRVAIGREGWPFTLTDRRYDDGLCPVTERLHENEAICFEPCAYDVDDALAAKMVAAIRKVHTHRRDLNALAETG